MSADKRSVHTDALAVLGTIIDETVGRDAIHLAVEPVIAGETLYAGQHIGLIDGIAFASKTGLKKLGIVDPFITGAIPMGARFLLVVFPRAITSLRHVWEHPDFEDEAVKKKVEPVIFQVITDEELNRINAVEHSIEWITDYAQSYGVSYDEIMETAKSHFTEDGKERWGDYINGGAEMEGEHTSEEFWKHFEIVTGIKVEDKNTNFFSCSC